MKSILSHVSKAWTKAPSNALSPQTLLASQALRDKLSAGENVRTSVLDLLDHLPPTYSKQIYGLLDKSLTTGELETLDLVKMYQGVVRNDTNGDLTNKLFLKLHKVKKVPSKVHLENALLYFEWLLNNRSADQALKFIRGAQKVYDLEEPQMMQLVSLLDTPERLNYMPDLFVNSQSAPSSNCVKTVYLNVCDRQAADVLERLTSVLLFERNFRFGKDAMVVILDSHLTLDVNGRRVVSLMVPPKEDSSLEYLELLVMAVMQFGIDCSTGQPLVNSIRANKSWVKETADLLLQWEVYSNSSIDSVIEKIEANKFESDATTLSGLLKVGDISRRSEAELTRLCLYFESNGISINAAGYAILISRALSGIEIEKARQLFIQSIEQGADWSMDDEAHAKVLSKLLCELCKSPHVDASVKFDAYQRIRMVVTSIEYDAQLEMLKLFLERDYTSDLATYLIEQWGETPNLDWQKNRQIYNAFFERIMACQDYRMAWELYRIFNTTISLPYESYLPIQQKFCSLGRPDAAHLMFRHLRNRAKKEKMQPPGREMYLVLFVEYGKWMYEEGMTELETYLRMDLNTELDIDIMNSMLMGYSALQDSPKVRDLWYETNGFAVGKGFNNLTGTVLLKHLAPMSLEAVDDLWAELPARYGIRPSSDNLREYLIANCYHGYYSRALEIAQQAKSLYGVEMDTKLLATLYNYTLLESRKKQVANWAQKAFPTQWQQLQESDQLKQVLLDNSSGQSEDHARYEAVRALKEQTEGTVPRALHKTTDFD